MTMKYIIVENEWGSEVPAIFDVSLIHQRVAQGLKGFPVSAGFVEIDGEVICHGRSESLDLDGRKEVDAELIKKSMLRSKP